MSGGAAYVNTGRVRALAQALDGLAATLKTDTAVIADSLGYWGGDPGVAMLRSRIAPVEIEAEAMWKRFGLALVAENQPAWLPSPDPHGGRTPISWDVGEAEMASLGRGLAAVLRFDGPGARQLATDVGALLARYRGDEGFNRAFYEAGGAGKVAGVARFLHSGDGTHGNDPLSAESHRIMADYGASVAATSALPGGDRLLSAIVHPAGDDFWSVGMLFAHGPTGTQYGKAFLVEMGRSVLDWRAKNRDGISYLPATYDSKTGPYPQVNPGGYLGNPDSWYGALGLCPDYRGVGGDDEAKIDAVLQNDPSRNILNVVGDNRGASTSLLAGERPDPATGAVSIDPALGSRAARVLLDSGWAMPKRDSKGDEAAAKVVLAATTPRQIGRTSELQAWAAANLFRAASEHARPWLDRTDNRTRVPPLPAHLTKALGAAARTYLLDLARSTRFRDLDGGAVSAGDFSVVQSDRRTVIAVLGLVFTDPSERGAFEAVLDANITAATTVQAHHPLLVRDDLVMFGRLAGLVQLVRGDMRASEIDSKAEAAARDEMYIKAAVEGTLGAAATVTGNYPAAFPVGVALAVATPAISESLPSSPPVDYTPIARDVVSEEETFFQPVAQGLVNAGVAHPPPDATWFRDGAIRIPEEAASPPRTADSRRDFADWWGGLHSDPIRPEDELLRGYRAVTAQPSTNSRAQTPAEERPSPGTWG